MSNIYIGVPNGVVMCFDEIYGHGQYRGRLYHRYHKGAIEIASSLQLVQTMEHLFDEIQFPRPNVKDRSFTEDSSAQVRRHEEKERVMSDKDILSNHGDIGTFIIKVQQRQAGTWQGRVTWVDRNKTVRFRSILELIKLMESGILAEHPELAEDDTATWDE